MERGKQTIALRQDQETPTCPNCGAVTAAPSLFAGIDHRLPTPTAAQRRYLGMLEQARPLGLTRITGGWRGLPGTIGVRQARALIAAGWARRDDKGWNPRLKITRLGREAGAFE